MRETKKIVILAAVACVLTFGVVGLILLVAPTATGLAPVLGSVALIIGAIGGTTNKVKSGRRKK
jgi:hypothetical protein